MSREIDSIKEVLMHAMEQQKLYPESATLTKVVKSLKRWLINLHKESMKKCITLKPDEGGDIIVDSGG